MMHEVRSVNIQGVPAQALAGGKITSEFRSVREAEDVDRELGNPGDQHHCPLCEEYFGWEAFKAHAAQCIDVRAPRGRVWLPPGFSDAAIQSYSEKVKAD